MEGGRVINRSLATAQESIAALIVNAIRLICKDKELLVNPFPSLLKKFEKRAVGCVFGEERAAELLSQFSGIAGEIARKF